MARIKILELDAALLLRLLKACDGQQHVIVTDVPPDARAISVGIDFDRRMLRVLMESATFPEVVDGCRPTSVIPEVVSVLPPKPMRDDGTVIVGDAGGSGGHPVKGNTITGPPRDAPDKAPGWSGGNYGHP